jgi:hypothetical protein
MKQPFRHARKPAAKTMDDIGTSNTKYTSYFREQQSCHGAGRRLSASRRVAPRPLPRRSFQGIGIVFSRQTERGQVSVGEPSIIGIGCSGVTLCPNN